MLHVGESLPREGHMAGCILVNVCIRAAQVRPRYCNLGVVVRSFETWQHDVTRATGLYYCRSIVFVRGIWRLSGFMIEMNRALPYYFRFSFNHQILKARSRYLVLDWPFVGGS